MAVKFFDEQWYLSNNPDVAEAVEAGVMTAQQHFEQFGVVEGRSPSPLFDAAYYLAQNEDVAHAVAFGLTTPYEHFSQHGHLEGRSASPYFDVETYLAQNPDVADAVEAGTMSAYEHFQAYGIHEGRSPLVVFDAESYLQQNPDVGEAVEAGHTTALQHFLYYGMREERAVNPVVAVGAYLLANSDVAEAVEAGHVTAWGHLLTYGVLEGRDLGNGVSGADFANDPVYQQAVAEGNGDAALARMTEVAPFLPSFEAPEGFELPADWPIPQDFVPVEGQVLTVPEGWTPGEPVQLPDYFEQPFTATITEGVVTFPAEATGEIQVINQEGQAVFAKDGFISAGSVPLDGTATVQLAAEQVLVGLHGDIAELTIKGEGSVRAEGTDDADTIDASEWNAVNLTIDAKGGDDVLTLVDTQTGIGGDGADTFVIGATVGTSSVITVADYNYEQGDVIDLSDVEGFNLFAMEVRGAEYDADTGTWHWGPEYTGDSIGIWLAPEVANVQITDARNDTLKFALPDIEGLDGFNTLQLNIADGGIIRGGDEAAEILRGGDGSQILIGGATPNILSGGAGNDYFVLADSASRLDSMDHIFDLTIGEDTLVADSLIVAGSFVNGGVLDNLEASTIATALNEATFAANAGAYFTVGEAEAARTFIVLNDGVAGYDAQADTIVEITGVTGDLSALSTVGVPQLDGVSDAVLQAFA